MSNRPKRLTPQASALCMGRLILQPFCAGMGQLVMAMRRDGLLAFSVYGGPNLGQPRHDLMIVGWRCGRFGAFRNLGSRSLTRMIVIIAHWFISAAILLVVARIVPGIDIEGWGSALIGALLLGLVNAFIRPLIVFFTLPITFFTLGLFLLIINALMLALVAGLVSGIRISGFGSAFVGSLLLTFLNLIVGALLRR